jgi:uncharacterized protein YdiU (UPF0061 family)
MIKNFGIKFDNSYSKLPQFFYTPLEPVPVKAPELVILNEELAKNMGLDFSLLKSEEKSALFGGNRILEGSNSIALAYAGHQFGHFTVLGDGRAILLGEHITPDHKRLDIQLKGSGRTPYSRRADGRAALGPMLREYVISEAMHYLGIPTTRSLAVVKTGENVMRERVLPGAILTRIASSHIRVGTFQFAASQGDPKLVKSLLDYTISRHYPGLVDSDNKAVALINAVIRKQADLIVHWMRVGFIHGVMNTDNMTLSGETIDYGPCAFMDTYDPNTVFSSIDHMGRYAYINQPKIAQWNIARLAEALVPLIHNDINKALDIAGDTINTFTDIYHDKWLSMMRAKLGLFGECKSDEVLIGSLLDWMQISNADFTNTFRDLSASDKPIGELYKQESFHVWYGRWQERLKQNTKPFTSSLCLMKSVNPAVIPRNHKVEQVLDAATYEGDLKPFHALLKVLKEPYKKRQIDKTYLLPPPPSDGIYQTFCGT